MKKVFSWRAPCATGATSLYVSFNPTHPCLPLALERSASLPGRQMPDMRIAIRFKTEVKGSVR
jgi:hypothetical protein